MSAYPGVSHEDLKQVAFKLKMYSTGLPEGGSAKEMTLEWSEEIAAAAKEIERQALAAQHWPANDYSWLDELLREGLPEGWKWSLQSFDCSAGRGMRVTSPSRRRYAIMLRAEFFANSFVWCDLNRLPDREKKVRGAIEWMKRCEEGKG